jgi:hypothetical protein
MQLSIIPLSTYELALSNKLNMVKLHKIELLHVHYTLFRGLYAGYMAKQMMLKDENKYPNGDDMGLCTLMGITRFFINQQLLSVLINQIFVTSVSQSLKKDDLKLFNIKNEIEVIPKFL